MSRVSKAVSLLFNQSQQQRSLIARPWAHAMAPYYIVGSRKESFSAAAPPGGHLLDRAGVPYTNTPEGKRYVPLIVARYGLRLWSAAALSGDRELREKALKLVPWLIDAAGESGVWEAGWPLPQKEPSALVQGVVISALTRFATVVHDPELDRVIRAGAQRLTASANDCGTVDSIEEGPFLEEFATRSHILNGCVFGLFGLYDLVDGYQFDEVREITGAIEATLIHGIHRFCVPNGWSRYALNVHGSAPLASAHYHESHIRLFTIIGQRTNAPELLRAIARWSAALDSPVTRTLVTFNKSIQVIWARDVRRLSLR